jgi:hypothetical protein
MPLQYCKTRHVLQIQIKKSTKHQLTWEFLLDVSIDHSLAEPSTDIMHEMYKALLIIV